MSESNSTVERFWAKVEKTDTCWLWTASTDGKGYGQFRAAPLPASPVKAYRFAYELVVGPIPEGHGLDHLCRVHACVNPGHLEPVTNLTNTLRGIGPSAVNARKTHCIRGHRLPPRMWDGNQKRQCKPCRRLRDQRRAA